MSDKARVVVLARRPGRMISVDDFQVVEQDLPELGADEVLVRNSFMSVDPYMRLALGDRPGFPATKPVGEAMAGGAVGVVEQSRSSALPPGSVVTSQNGWRDAFVAPASTLQPVSAPGVPLSWHIGVLGLAGITAYAGVEFVLDPKPGETIFVSGAAGAVGSLAAQLAKRRGCKVIGTAGSEEKVAWLKDVLKLDAVANYKTTNLRAFLAEQAPSGLDYYFDNVGGPTLDAAILAMRPKGVVVVCGAISQYNEENYCAGPQEFFQISAKGLTFIGLNVGMWYFRAAEAIPALISMLTSGELIWEETVVDGLENAPAAFVSLFSGANMGKMVVRLGG